MRLPSETTTTPGEARVLARKAAAAYRDMVEEYKKEYQLAHQEAVARVEEPDPPNHLESVLHGPPDEVSFFDLERLGERDPERMLTRWDEVKQAALEELQSGDRAAAAVEGYCPSCWGRAQFAAILTDLIESWQPRGGLERLLLDQMAVAHSAMLEWMQLLTQRSCLECARQERHVREKTPWETPQLSEAEALEQAAAMVDRFHKMFLRTLRALCNLRKVPVAVVVQNAGQVNIGQQQVNTQSSEARPQRERRRAKPRECTCRADQQTLIDKSV